MDWLLTFYIGTTIFGVGVTLIDIFGSFVDHDHDGDGNHDDGGEDHDPDEDSEDENSEQHSALKQSEHPQSVVAFDHGKRKGVILKILSMSRNLVYFSLGFGPVGCFAFLMGTKGLLSLAFSVPFGLVALIGSRLLKRVQKQVLDSQIKEAELIMEQAEVLVSIKPGQIGKIRIQYGNTYVYRYAKAKNPADDFTVGMTLQIVDIAEDYLIVDKE